MPVLAHINATIEAILERIDDTLERYLALKLAIGVWIAIAVPTFAVWMISQKNVITAFDVRFIIAGDVILFSLWAALTIVLHIHNRRDRAQERGGDEYFCGLHGWVPLSHFPCSGLRESEQAQ